jgi:hypothetical protein
MIQIALWVASVLFLIFVGLFLIALILPTPKHKPIVNDGWKGPRL